MAEGGSKVPSSHPSSSRFNTQRVTTDLNKYLNQKLEVRLHGGRQVCGILRGHDSLIDLVLDETVETLRDPSDPYKLTDQTRFLGLIVIKGTAVIMMTPQDGTEEIANPFVAIEQ